MSLLEWKNFLKNEGRKKAVKWIDAGSADRQIKSRLKLWRYELINIHMF